MVFVAEFSIPSAEFSFGSVLQEYADLTIEFERVVPTHHGLMPFVFARGPVDFAGVEATIQEDPTVEEVVPVEQFDEGRLYRIEWKADERGLATALVEARATLLEGIGRGTTWRFEIRFRNQERIEQFQELIDDRDLALELERLRARVEMPAMETYGLTEKQYETLVTAFEMGYFESPKETTLSEIGEEFDISDASVTGRLKRGLAAVLADTVMRGEEADADH